MDVIKSFLDGVRDDGRVFYTPTQYKGKPAIRAAISNWLTQQEDLDVAFEVINTVQQKLKKEQMAEK
jgi:hypothetical protein